MAPHHLIFEGAELAGKSWLMSRVYDYLEPKYNKSGYLLDGCHWFNCDVGVYGTKHGRRVIGHYLRIFKELQNKNLLIEKLYLSDMIYSRLHWNKEINYRAVEKKLKALNFKIILITFPEDTELIKNRLKDRLNIYPHYERILRDPAWYIKQQQEYLKEIKKGSLPYLILEARNLPDEKLPDKVLEWIKEKKSTNQQIQ